MDINAAVMTDADTFLTTLYRRHGSALLRLAARLLGGDWHRAQDIVQEVAIRAWQRPMDVGPMDATARHRLFTVVDDLVGDLVRDAHQDQVEPRMDMAGEADMAMPAAPDAVDQTLTARVVWDALADLAPPQREVLLQLHYLDRSVSQAARVLGVPPGTVKSRTYYATRALRSALRARGITDC
ncbi:sigma-70 family RNA polymerase sigma factor [Streptomyces iranensis]|uniref:RNA polymerase sigma-70 factor (ECF subfamily) n=1 Tax=Streptomyces iranensis TaxID=576784 RepID=A0A060ZF81_9ACTN|nr:sigma-70 family RNA polymerase sigma factor [Streptomyces iranensis]MBP2062571.1 RNA polymerase sigma-70 factor (ECF subfamily) [Streptomyces iranensis]CDR04268.1 RNA polymerase, sigma-24 subunit, ECF subfamily [Streptomyces iranensis]